MLSRHFENYVSRTEESYIIQKLNNNYNYFIHCRSACFATEVYLYLSHFPSGNIFEGKSYFSVKRKLDAYKFQLSVFPTGPAYNTPSIMIDLFQASRYFVLMMKFINKILKRLFATYSL